MWVGRRRSDRVHRGQVLEEGVRRAREQRLAEAFREAASDPAFLEDVEEAMRDFRDADAEQEGSR
jgi:UDP:flavonoid glycosyltransferase YjiC (YdhE family)